MSEIAGSSYDQLIRYIQAAFEILSHNDCLKGFNLRMHRAMGLELATPPPGATILTSFLHQLDARATLNRASLDFLSAYSTILPLFLELLDAIQIVRACTRNKGLFAEDLAALIGGSVTKHGWVSNEECRSYKTSIIPTAAIVGILHSNSSSESVAERVSYWLNFECPGALSEYCGDEIASFLGRGEMTHFARTRVDFSDQVDRLREIINGLPLRAPPKREPILWGIKE